MTNLMAAIALAVLASGIDASANVPIIRVSIVPGRMDGSRGSGNVRVAIDVPGVHVDAGQPLFDFPTGDDLVVTDARGAVDIASRGAGEDRFYVATRAVDGDLRIAYRVAIRNSVATGGTTPIFPRVDGDGFSALGMAFLATPHVAGSYRLALRWDLSAMGPGATGVSSFGDGDATVPAAPVDRLRKLVMMAGRLNREPAAGGTGKFAAVWSGDPGYDLRPTMRWAQRLHGWMVDFFRTPDDPAYRVFARENGGLNAGGGVAFPNSFFQTWGRGVTGDSMRGILAHEMVHTFTANDLGRWYVEGDAVYYQVRLPWRAGMVSTDQYLRDINMTAYRYYTNLKIAAHEDEIDPAFFSNPWLNTLAYDRGALYFAQLDGMIRRKTGGKRSIDDLVRVMVRTGRDGETITDETWFALLREGIGEEAVALTKSMLAGGIVLPESDAYGPCFRRVAARLRRYELGFTVARKPAGTPVEVKGLIAGSEADKAGVRNGDMIALPLLTSDGPRRDFAATVTAQVTRDGRTFPVTWAPRGAAVDGYQWERVAGVPDSACRP
ncbi:peptidase M61 [Sphingomonas sp. CL5.1]|uniref:peptidase M61 n=1 Tax=Sphingomonas sp. CL5.1 TaxID=2653203 RepID=UPI00158163A8|nr:peptidase M61 [Sphingomonas sp. CL5.1]QKR99601.1 peptidase M61 [Sphingomonas sp. CL5.1]